MVVEYCIWIELKDPQVDFLHIFCTSYVSQHCTAVCMELEPQRMGTHREHMQDCHVGARLEFRPHGRAPPPARPPAVACGSSENGHMSPVGRLATAVALILSFSSIRLQQIHPNLRPLHSPAKG